MKKTLKQEKEYIEAEIEICETFLNIYKDKLTSDEIDEVEDEIKEYKLQLEEDFENFTLAIKGNIVWFGNEKGINATKSK